MDEDDLKWVANEKEYYSAGIDFRRHNLTSKLDPRTARGLLHDVIGRGRGAALCGYVFPCLWQDRSLAFYTYHGHPWCAQLFDFAACDYCENKPRNPKKYSDTQHQPVTDFKFIQEEHYVENTKLVGGPMLKIYLKVLVHCTSLTGYGFTRKASRLLH